MKLQAPLLKTTTYQLSDATGGNGNKRLESGETATIVIKNLNVGHSQSTIATGILTTDSPWLTISSAVVLGNIDALTGQADATFTVTVAAQCPAGCAR